MQRYFVYLAYDGTAYHGWQIQPNGASVQECLMKALSTLLRREVEVVGAGRTDAGVHASLMVAHFDSDSPLDTVFMTDKLNRLLPPDISVYRLRAVKSDAHARFDATARMYKYYVTTAKSPFNRQYRCRLFQTPDFERMNEAAQTLFDYTDFTSFSKLGFSPSRPTGSCGTWYVPLSALYSKWVVENFLLKVSDASSNRRTVARQEPPFPEMHCFWWM